VNKYGLNPHLRAFRQSWEDIAVLEDKIIEDRRAQRAARRKEAAQGREQEVSRGERKGGVRGDGTEERGPWEAR
jgi:hypothetical protein